MGKGKQFELDTKRDLNDNTKSYVKAHRCDYSGSSSDEAADVMVVWQAERYEPQRPCGHSERHVAYAELKKRSGEEAKRTTVMSGSSQGQSGLEELQELRKELPTWAKKVVGVKFPNRELMVIDALALEHWLRRNQEGWGQDWFEGSHEEWRAAVNSEARLTPSDNISMVMPPLSVWPSQREGLPPWEKLARSVGLEAYDFL